MLISADKQIETKLKVYLSNQEAQIIVPFTYSSFEEKKGDPFFIRETFRRFFYSRDLFDYSEPLKKDTFFFGRSDIVTSVIEKHKSGSNQGLFGLRKTGKTSIIFDIQRKSVDQDYLTVFIDCQDTSFNMRRWNYALYYICDKIQKSVGGKTITESNFSIENAAQLFHEYLNECSCTLNKTILLLFDEIENITFGKSSVDHWCNDLDFVYFWQSIRSSYQRSNNIFTFAVFGTNAKCVEDPTILGKDNPIFNFFQPFYIPGFHYDQTREMVRRLGRIMGLKFEEEIYAHLMEDYGGHPFLIRRICSKIAQLNPNRPVTIDRSKYNEAKKSFNLENVYFEMILNVLQQFYPDEYEMLTLLALNDLDNFNYFVFADQSLVTHLVGYGLIRQNDKRFDFRIDAIKDFLVRKNGNHPILKTPKEKWEFMCTRRNELESRLRIMVRTIIKFVYHNEESARKYILKKVFGNDPRFEGKKYSELFDSRNVQIYLRQLIDVINANWDYFSDYFGKQDIFLVNMAVLKTEGRFDAHATVPDDDEINTIEHSLSYLNNSLEKYESSISG